MYDVKVIDKITDIEESDWNNVVNKEDIFFSYEWFKTIESSKIGKLIPRHILVYENNRLVGIAPCYIQYDDPIFTVDDILFGKLKNVLNKFRINMTVLPALVCFSPFSHSGGICYKGKFKRKIVSLVIKNLEIIARNEKILLTAFLNIPESNFRLFNTLEQFKFYKIKSFPNTYMEVGWNSFEDYLKHLSSKIRCEIRRQIRKNNQYGLKMTWENSISSVYLFKLYKNVYKKYSNKKDLISSKFFDNVKKYMKDNISFIQCKNADNKIIGFILVFKKEKILFARMVGLDYNLTKKNFTYFVLFYEIIKKAINERCKKIYFSPTAYDFKIKIGCNLENSFHFIKFENRTVNKLVIPYIKMTRGFENL